MDMTSVNPVRDELFKNNQQFRELVQQHENYEKRLSELASLTYPNEEELLEESTLKKKKLAVKDELYAMMDDFSKKKVIEH
ncbi:MAG: YdcH family protein [Pyrinomonadaceae bacterium]|nr:YdcH family protein [Pyrinomonadaceae bacterium]